MSDRSKLQSPKLFKTLLDRAKRVSLDGGKRYSQVVETSFHISMAALEPTSGELPKGKRAVSLWIQHEKAEFLLCTLEHNRMMQQPLDLNFTEGEEISLFSTGADGSIHLSGYLMDEPIEDNEIQEMSEGDMTSEEEDSEAEVPELLPLDDITFKPGKKRKMSQEDPKKKKPKILMEEDLDSDSDEDDADYSLGDQPDDDAFDDNSDDDDDEDDVDEDDDDDEDDDEEEVEAIVEKVTSLPKKNKTPIKVKEQITPLKNTENTPKNKTPKVNGATPGESSKKKNKKDTSLNTPSHSAKKKKEETPSKTDTPKKRVLADGLVVEDIKVGNGPSAKPNKMIHMYYVGTLSNGKQFDSCSSGKPFKFRLSKQEVIKGWDIGVQGMQVGGKRRLIVPPKLGYGNQKQGPIPANSTLVFDVELKAVS